MILGAVLGFYCTVYLLTAAITDGVTLVPDTVGELVFLGIGSLIGLVATSRRPSA